MRFCWQRVYSFFCFSSETPLHSSSRQGYLEICKFLVVSGADVNVKDDEYDARPYQRIRKCGRDCGIVCNVFILFCVSGYGLLCIGYLFMATSIFANCSWLQKPTSVRGTGVAVVGVQCALPLPSTHSLPCSGGYTPLTHAIKNNKRAVVAYLRGIGAPL